MLAVPNSDARLSLIVAQGSWALKTPGHSSCPEAHSSLSRGKVMCLQKEKGEVAGWKAVLQLCCHDLTAILGDVTEFWCLFSLLSCYAFMSDVSDVSSGTKNPGSSKETECFFVWAILYLSVMLVGWKHPAARSWPLRPVWLWKCY